MRCVRSHQPIAAPAAQAGSHVWGPKCARLAGMLPPPKKTRAQSLLKGIPRRVTAGSEADPRQMSLELTR